MQIRVRRSSNNNDLFESAIISLPSPKFVIGHLEWILCPSWMELIFPWFTQSACATDTNQLLHCIKLFLEANLMVWSIVSNDCKLLGLFFWFRPSNFLFYICSSASDPWGVNFIASDWLEDWTLNSHWMSRLLD